MQTSFWNQYLVRTTGWHHLPILFVMRGIESALACHSMIEIWGGVAKTTYFKNNLMNLFKTRIDMNRIDISFLTFKSFLLVYRVISIIKYGTQSTKLGVSICWQIVSTFPIFDYNIRWDINVLYKGWSVLKKIIYNQRATETEGIYKLFWKIGKLGNNK